MPFEWYHPDVPPAYTVAPEKASKMYADELSERAALLLRLGYSQEEAVSRLRGNVRWDFELHEAPAVAGAVEGIVSRVYGSRGHRGGGAPTL